LAQSLQTSGIERIRDEKKVQYVDNVRLSFSGENLFVLSGFSGVDPELPAEVGSQYKAGSVGVAISPYPQARKFMFGLNVTF
jgi:hypothetical protein